MLRASATPAQLDLAQQGTQPVAAVAAEDEFDLERGLRELLGM
ncbi:hypothetical protein [Hymenobacter defluvii]|nr:hypothetical protein [Hymenobacter defluvii]